LFLVAAAGAYAAPAHAFNNDTHERIPDQAYQTMNILRRGEYLSKKVSAVTGTSVPLLSARPASVPASQQAQWDKYIAELRLAPGKLELLRTGLANPQVGASQCPMYPTLNSGEKLGTCRAGDIPFAPKRKWATNTSDCFVRNYFAGDSDAPEFFDELPSTYAGSVLGYWAQNVDDEVKDTMLWIRPTNILIFSEIKAVLEDLSQWGLTILFAPFACLFSLFSGSNCLDDARSAAHDADPVTAIDEYAADVEKAFLGAFPLTGIDGDDLFDMTGVWHYINVERGYGDFNDIGGLHYTQGGWRGGPTGPFGIGRIDALDYAVIAGCDAGGLTIDPDTAGGVRNYQQSPDGPLHRRKGDWLLSMGHTEFEPLDNLALYGWRRFQSDHDAAGLGWVLHALGDAVEPHHGISATGWGHRPFEDFTSYEWNEMLSESGVNHYFSLQRVLEQGFSWWSWLDNAQQANPSDLPIRTYITNVARTTRQNSDWAIKTGVSLGYGSSGTEPEARAVYGTDEDKVRGQVEMGIGATLAFLAKASQFTVDESSDPKLKSPCTCTAGSARGVTCVANCPASAPDPASCEPCSRVKRVESDGHCVESCPADQPLLNAQGHCEAACTAPPCTGVACPGSSPFVEGTSCVAQCSSANQFAVGRECRSSCPPGKVQSLTTPSFCETEPHCRAATGTRDANGLCDEHCPTGWQFIENHACVAQCTTPFYVMNGQFGDCKPSCESYTLASAVISPKECLKSCPESAPYTVGAAEYSTTDDGKCYAGCPSGYGVNFETNQYFCFPIPTPPDPPENPG
jgi:hypothetical protein